MSNLNPVSNSGLWLITLVLVFSVFVDSLAYSQTDLPIANWSFENDMPEDEPSGWIVADGFNPFWIGDFSAGPSDPSSGFDGANFISGSWQYAGLENANSLIGGAANEALIYQDVDLTPYADQIAQGVFLGLSYAFYDGDPNDVGTIAFDFYDSNGELISNAYSEETIENLWVFVEDLGAAAIPINATSLRISIGAYRVSGGGGSARNVAFDAISASLQAEPPPVPVTDIVKGNLIQINSDGNWTWYSDERAVFDPNTGNFLVNSIGFDRTVRMDTQVDLVNFNPFTGRRVKTQLSGQPGNPSMQSDDHNNAALLVLPDGRYLAMYANHGNSGGLGDRWTRWRTSTAAGDSTNWTTEQLFDWRAEVPGASSASGTAPGNITYHNIFYLSAEDQVYNISRSYGRLSTNGATQNMPNIVRYDIDANSIEWGGQFLESKAQGYSAYPKYVSDGVERIYFITTETHPRNFNNSIWGGYIADGKTFDMLGNVIDDNIFDNGTVEGGSGFVSDVTDFTRVLAPDPLGEGYNRLWTTDLALDSAGAPMGLFTSRWNIDGATNSGTTGNPIDHRLHFTRWNSESQTWDTQEIAKMGRRLYGSEQDYTGLGALVPGDENTLYVSTTYDPRDPTGLTATARHEIYKGVYDGASWNWTAITENSSVDNLRPIVPDNFGSQPNTVFWFRGVYTTAQFIRAAVVGYIDRGYLPNLVTYIDANATNTRFINGAPLVTSTPTNGMGPADDAWHERTGFGNDGSVLTSNELGVEDAPTLVTTIDGLSNGDYDVYAFFWSDNDEDWRLMAGLEQGNLMDYRMRGSQHADESQFGDAIVVGQNRNDLLLYRAYLGRATVTGESPIEVFVDDFQTLNGADSRTWFDGVGYASVGLPLVPVSFEIVNGTLNSGSVTELSESDNVDLSLRRNDADAISRVVITTKAISPVTVPVSLAFTLESSVFARSEVTQIIELFNYDSNEWEQLDLQTAQRFSDKSVTVNATGDVGRFFDNLTGCVEARVSFRSATNRQKFSANIDQVRWLIE